MSIDSIINAANTIFKNVTGKDANSSSQVGGLSAQNNGTPSAQQGYLDRTTTTEDEYPYYPWGYGGYGGFGSSGGGKTPEEIQKETQAQIDNTAGNFGNRGKDLSELGQMNLGNIKDQIAQNTALYNANRRQANRQVEWQPNQQRQQSVLGALKDKMGNAIYGSGFVDLMEGLARVDDMNDVSLINAWTQSDNSLFDNWFQSNEDLISDYVEQVTAIKDEFSKLYSQYWSTISNINPLLAAANNIAKSAKGESSSVGEGTDAYTLPGALNLLPTEELQKMFEIPERASAINPYTRNYVRPDRDVTTYNSLSNTGTRNQSTAANRGFLDNLNVYQRRV